MLTSRSKITGHFLTRFLYKMLEKHNVVSEQRVTCYVCNRSFEPDPARMKAWAESGRSFDPTDWECSDCQNYEPEHEAESTLEVSETSKVCVFERVKIKDAPIGAIVELSDGSVGYVEFPFDMVTDPNFAPLGLDPDDVVTVLITPTDLASKWINSYNYEIAKPITPARRFRYLVTASLFLLAFGSCTGLAAILLIAVR